MKKSRIAKLSLMGASIAALAATLTTSTYAWYVTNKQADVKGGTGNTGTAQSDGSVLLSWTGAENTFFKEITWAEGQAAGSITGASLSPVHLAQSTDYKYEAVETPDVDDIATYYEFNATSGAFAATEDVAINSAKTYYTRTGLTAGTFYSDAGAVLSSVNGYIHFELYIMTEKSSAVTVTPHLTITTSKQAANAGQVAYTNVGLPTQAGALVQDAAPSKGQVFTVNAKEALYYRQTVGTTVGATVAVDSSTVTGGNAHTYYNSVVGEAPWNVTPLATGSLTTFDSTTTKTKLSYDIWLDGADTDCFNSCAQWDFDIQLYFTVA